MPLKTCRRARWLAPVLATAAWTAACMLEPDTPTGLPPETWDSPLNTHPDGPAFQELLDWSVRGGLPGVVLLVRTPAGQWNGAAGYAKIETAEPMRVTHRHFAASVTKMYTAAGVLLLAEDGLIDLDARIREYLPETVCGPIPNGSQATVRQLLGHTSGIPDFSGALAYELDTLNDPMGSYPPERMLAYVHGQSPIFAPGAGYFYSNVNYLLLTLVMDRVTGASHADVITERILRPLGLTATCYRNEPGYPQTPGLVNSYEDLAGGGRLVNVSDLTIHGQEESVGYAGLIASSADFSTFIESLLDGRLVGRQSLAEMLKGTEHYSGYGLGLSVIETPWGAGVGHSGDSLGIMSRVQRFPDVGVTLVLLANSGSDGRPGKVYEVLWEEAMESAMYGL